MLDIRSKPSTLAGIAAIQHGVVTSAQIEATGHGRATITSWLRTGRLHKLHRGVYSLGYVSPSPYARMMAAVLACGPAAAISHLTAASLWEIEACSRGHVEVTTTVKRWHPGITVHRTRRLTADDVTTHHGIPVTSLARTLVDIASTLERRALTRALNEARVRHRLADTTLKRTLATLPTCKGMARLRELLEYSYAPTRSALEDRFLELVARYRLPRPEVNQLLLGYEVDMLWRQAQLVVELDGRLYHQSRFEQDRERDAQLTAAGYRVVRITWQRLQDSPAREAARLKQMLARR